MSTAVIEKIPSSDLVVLDRRDGSKLVVHLFGATILSWENRGKEVLFLSENAVFNNKKAIRGGIPLIFPCFGPWDKGPQHGFARIKRWQVASPSKEEDNGDISCSLTLTDDEETRQMWDYQFKLLFTAKLGESSLSLKLEVHNTGSQKFDFTTLMHTYFKTDDIGNASVSGLQNLTYIDKVADGKEAVENRELVVIPENYDRVYKDCPNEIKVKGVADGHLVQIKKDNLPDIVVWNPWADKAKAMADFGDEEYKTMLCVEAGSVSKPVLIGSGEKKDFTQIISML